MGGSAAIATAIGARGSASVDTKIVSAKIHPAIGVARIGNSPSGYFIGPEVTEPPLTQAGQSRDAAGALKRQVARFRVYGYNAAGEVVRELTADEAKIEWTVHVANKKAAWYQFLAALDLPEAGSMAAARRNPDVKGQDRKSLIIDPGPRAITGQNISGAQYRFDSGMFGSTSVSLGELRTDSRGRLLFFGGLGKAGSPGRTLVFDEHNLDSFNNASGWWDDTSDGPVKAKVTLQGRELEVEPAWVIVAPPNYAPDLIGWRTAYELLTDAFMGSGMLKPPGQTSFSRDVLPILKRLASLQWVNKGLEKIHGRGSEMNFEDPKIIARLSDKREIELRKRINAFFRLEEGQGRVRELWPQMYGDAYGSFKDSDRENLHVPQLYKTHLERWVAGDYVDDWSLKIARKKKPYRRIEEVPLELQPQMLDKAALHFCLADAFHPGCELTWPIRHTSMYSSPFRIQHRVGPERDYGDRLTQDIVRQVDGPLYGQGPGDLTRWMAIPWHGDTVFCRSGYESELDPYLPTYWPARVPNQVLTEADYKTVMNAELPRETRKLAYDRREHWLRAFVQFGMADQILEMVRDISKVGVVEARPGIQNDPDFPEIFFVETLASQKPKKTNEAPTGAGPRSAPTLEDLQAQKAGFKDAAQLRAFRRARRLE